MPRKAPTPYVILDENILDDPKIEDLIAAEGMFGFGVYVGFLTLVRKYEDEDYMIAFDRVESIFDKYFNRNGSKNSKKVNQTLLNHVKNVIATCIDVGLFEQLQNEQGKRYFYSIRRTRDLLEQKELRAKNAKGAEETNKKLGRGQFKVV